MHISECGRRVIVGLLPLFETLPGVIEERRRGQECIAFERVLRRMGRYVNLSYVPVTGGAGTVGAEKNDEGEISWGDVGCFEGGR